MSNAMAAMAAMAATASEQHLRAAVPLPLALQSDPYFKIGRPQQQDIT
jgi:hypothetical protein